jgi:hypothetical protein
MLPRATESSRIWCSKQSRLWREPGIHKGISYCTEFTAAVGLHLADAKQSADAVSRARGQVTGVQRMYSAVNKPARGKPDRNPY